MIEVTQKIKCDICDRDEIDAARMFGMKFIGTWSERPQMHNGDLLDCDKHICIDCVREIRVFIPK